TSDVTLGFDTQYMQRNRQQADGYLLARRRDDVEFARFRIRRNFSRKREQPIGLPADRRRYDDQLMAIAVKPGNAPGDIAYALGVADRSSSVLLNDQGHSRATSDRSEGKCRVGSAKAERVGQRGADLHRPRVIGHEI